MDQSKLSPKEQSKLFELMQKAGAQPTTNMGEASPMGAPDPQAQEGIDPAHAAFLQGAGHLPDAGAPMPAAPTAPAAQPQQPGFLSKLGTGVGNFVGMASGIKPMLMAGSALSQPKDPNLYEAWRSKMASTLDPATLDSLDKRYRNKSFGEQQLSAVNAAFGEKQSTKPHYTTPQLNVIMNAQATAEDFKKAFGDHIPQDATADWIKMHGQSEVGNRFTESQWNKFSSAINTTIGRSNSAAGVEARKLFAANHVQSLIDQARSQADGGDPRQVAEAAISAASLLMTNGVVTESMIDRMIPNTARAKIANWKEWLLNDPSGTNGMAFMDRLQDTVKRQKSVAQTNLKNAIAPSALGFSHLRKQNQEQYDNMIMAAANQGFTIDDTGRVVPVPQQATDENGNPVPSSPVPNPVAGGSRPKIRVLSVKPVKGNP